MSAPTSTNSPRFGSTSIEVNDDLFAFDGAEALRRAWGAGLEPDAWLTVSEWAARHRMLAARASAEPGRYRTARSRDSGNTMLSKEFAVGLRLTPARYIFLDEVDAYPASADDEGDPVTLAEARSLTFAHRRKVFLVSTPTIHGLSRIEREYEASAGNRASCRRGACLSPPAPMCRRTGSRSMSGLRVGALRAGWSTMWLLRAVPNMSRPGTRSTDC